MAGWAGAADPFDDTEDHGSSRSPDKEVETAILDALQDHFRYAVGRLENRGEKQEAEYTEGGSGHGEQGGPRQPAGNPPGEVVKFSQPHPGPQSGS